MTGFWIISTRGVIHSIDNVTRQYFGTAADDLIGLSVFKLLLENACADLTQFLIEKEGSDLSKKTSLEFYGRYQNSKLSLRVIQGYSGESPPDRLICIVKIGTHQSMLPESGGFEHLSIPGNIEILNYIELGICRVDEHGQIIESGTFCNTMFGQEKGNGLVGQSIIDMGIVTPTWWQKYTQKDNDGKVFSDIRSVRVLPKDRMRYFRITGHQEIPGGTRPVYRLFFQDITVVKELERELLQAQKMEAAGRLSSGIAHDFKNIMNAIIGYTQLLQMDDLVRSDQQSHKNLLRILEMSHRAVDLVQKLSRFTRQPDPGNSRCQVNGAIQEVAEMLKHTTSKELNIHINFDSEYVTAKINPVEFQQVLMNLALNAWDAMEDSKELFIQTKSVQFDEEMECYPLNVLPGEYVKVDIQDHGMGMDERTLRRVFDPFYTTKQAEKGTGLGLAITKSILENYHSGVHVESEPGKGTTFSLYMPRYTEDHAKSDRIIDPGFNYALKEVFTILVVDDELHLREMQEQFLTSLGQNVLTAEDGRKGLDFCEVHSDIIDLILLDIKMPRMTGVEMLRNLRKFEPDIPVLIVTGYITEEEKRECQNFGVAGFLEKPYSFNNLTDRLIRILSDRTPKQQIVS